MVSSDRTKEWMKVKKNPEVGLDSECEASLVMPASKNLHNSGSSRLFRRTLSAGGPLHRSAAT
jgi:hypothetical protein